MTINFDNWQYFEAGGGGGGGIFDTDFLESIEVLGPLSAGERFLFFVGVAGFSFLLV